MSHPDQPSDSSTGGSSGEQALRVERTYRRWLRLYPAPFRQQHGDEVLSTLLDAAGDPPRVQTREVIALAIAALRSRAQLGRRERPGAVAEGLRVALVTISATSILGSTWFLLAAARGDIGSTAVLTALSTTGLVLMLAGLLLAMRAQLSAAAALAALDAMTGMANNVIISSGGQSFGRYGVINSWLENLGYPLFALLLLGAVGLVASRNRRNGTDHRRMTVTIRPWQWRYYGVLVAVAVVAGTTQAAAPNSALATAAGLLSLITMGVLVVVGLVDARAALAAAILLGRQVLLTASWQSPAVLAVLLTLSVALMARGLRRGRGPISAATQ